MRFAIVAALLLSIVLAQPGQCSGIKIGTVIASGVAAIAIIVAAVEAVLVLKKSPPAPTPPAPPAPPAPTPAR